MQVTESLDDAHDWVRSHQRRDNRVALVPTMGALHAGHLSLVREGLARCEQLAVSIFVNPTQFAPHDDLSRYPRTLDNDLALLRAAGAGLVFTPHADRMYPSGASTWIEPPAVAVPLEGCFRPGHFRGVATIVLKLFQILPADLACFGKKDYQQWRVIENMVRDFNVPIEIIACETIRDADGLAMSSRNRYLDSEQREKALGISRALGHAADAVTAGERSPARLEKLMRDELSRSGFERIDYAAIADPEALQPVEQVAGPVVALIAAYLGSTRLIDNRWLG